MRRLLALLLIAFLLVSMAACGQSQPSEHTHSYTETITKPATCTEEGEKILACDCGDSYTERIFKSGHSWSSWQTVTEPTDSADGVAQRECSVCKLTETKPVGKPSGNVMVTQEQLDAIKNAFLELVNQERQQAEVGMLTTDAHLDSCALLRSQEIVDKFSHTRPNEQSFSSAVDTNQYAYILISENLAMTSHVGTDYYYPDKDQWEGTEEQIRKTAVWAFEILKDSPAHYAAMIDGDYKDTGIGITCDIDKDDVPYFYIAQLFGTKEM